MSTENIDSRAEPHPSSNEYIDGITSSPLAEWLPYVFPYCARMDRPDLEDCIELIKEFYREQKPEPLSTEGPCIRCGSHISYEPLSFAHKKSGEEWLRRLRVNYRVFKISFRLRAHHDFRTSTYIEDLGNMTRFHPYLCMPCRLDLQRQFEGHSKEWRKEEAEKQKKWADQREQQRAGELQERAALRTMPYKQFLKTDHWLAVRKKALRKANYKCELCAAQAQLHVHHKTYEHRGNEDRYPEDLIVLCFICHGKFHDKVAG